MNRPYRKLFYILLAVYFIWMAILLVMYFKTVRPERMATQPVTEKQR